MDTIIHNKKIFQHPAFKVSMAGLLYLLTSIFCIYISFTENIAQIWFSNALLLIIIFRGEPSLRWWYFGAGLIANIVSNASTGSTFAISIGLAWWERIIEVVR